MEGWKGFKKISVVRKNAASFVKKFAFSTVIKTLALLFFLAITYTSCQPNHAAQLAFYYWKTQFALSDVEKNHLDALRVNKLYVKFFDITWDAGKAMPVPVAEVEGLEMEKWRNWGNGKLEITPCIFITNQTFQQIAADQIEWLSERVQEKLAELKPENMSFREIQFDCDWTASTREKYFQFLAIFKKNNGKPQPEVCATIRLHQFRDFPETGVPPVDRGMLMFYNTGDVEDWNEENSILNLEAAKFYLKPNISYPLPLDLALPLFSWGVLFRDGRMIRLINNLRSENLADTSRFLKIADNRFEVVKSTYLNGYYLYKDDRIRTEAIDTQRLLKAVDLLNGKLKNPSPTVAFYHLDTATIKYFPHEFLEKIIPAFR